MVNFRLVLIYIAFSFAVSSCDNDIEMTDSQMHEKALSLSLEDRYDFYMKIYRSTTPRNPILAEDIVRLGQPARIYTMKRAATGSGVELGAALTVLSEFSEGCSTAERAELLKIAEKVSSSQDQHAALINRVTATCIKPPLT